MATRAFMSQPMWTRSEGWPSKAEHEARVILMVAEPMPDGYQAGWRMYRGPLLCSPDAGHLGATDDARNALAESLASFLSMDGQ